MMGQDNITWTGARAPGVERCRSLAWRCSTEQVDSDTERRPHAAAESTKGGGKPDLPTGMLGASLTEADQGRPYLIGQLWSRTEGKPAVRNLRGDDGNGGIIRSPQRAIVLPDRKRSPRVKRIAGILGVPSQSKLGEGLCRRRCLELTTSNSSGSQGTACQEGMCSESPELLAGCLGAPAQRRHRI